MAPAKNLLFTVLLCAARIARADLDLTPTVESMSLDQVSIRHVVFHDGPKKVTYQPPGGWTCSGSHDYASLSIPNHAQARAFIQVAPRLRIPALDDKAGKLFQDNPGLLQLPRGAKDIKINAVTQNPLVVDGHPTLEVQLTYSFFGQGCAKCLILVNRNGSEVSFVLDCPAPDYNILEPQLRRSLFSIENL
jgi:hypothetical protein